MPRNKPDTVKKLPPPRLREQRGAASHRRLRSHRLLSAAQDLVRPRRTNVRKQRRAAEVHQGRGRRDGRRPVLRPARRHAALHGARLVVQPGRLRRRPELRRLLGPRLPGHPRVRHVAVPGPDDGVPRPVPHRQDAGRELLHPRPAHRRGLLPRPAQHRPQGAGLPRQHRHRRHGVLRARGRVLRLRLGPLRDQAERRLLPHRLRGRRLEHRLRGQQPRLQGEVQGRLLPRRAVRPLRRPPRRDRHRDREDRPASSSVPTTRSAPPARPRSTAASTSCSRPPTTS